LRGCPRVGAPATCKKYRRKKPPWSSSVAAIPLDFPIGPYGSNHSPDSVAAHRCPRVATEQRAAIAPLEPPWSLGCSEFPEKGCQSALRLQGGSRAAPKPCK
jgi:hypothetical protein